MTTLNGLGRHILAELYDCDADLLNDPNFLKKLSLEAVERSGATIMSHHFKTFEPQGVSGVVVIAESHLSFHTWPEYGYMALDYFTCGENVDIQLAVDTIKKAVRAGRTQQVMHDRGQDLADRPHCPVPVLTRPEPSVLAGRPNQEAGAVERWVTEHHLDPATHKPILGFDYLMEGEWTREDTKFQQAFVGKNPVYGTMLFLDGYLMLTEKDEFVYHEMLAHVPMMLVKNPKRVLIIGGGDCGLALRVLEHDSVEHLDMVEIDGQVVELSRRHFPNLTAALDDPRFHLHVADGAKFVAQAPENSYDLVLVDSTDPIGPGKVLFETPFYENIRRILGQAGLMAGQSLSPWVQRDEQREMYANLGNVWPFVNAYHATVPTYPGGQWTFCLAGARPLDLTNFDRPRADRIAEHCRYYTPQIQIAAFHLPKFVAQNTTEVARTAWEDRHVPQPGAMPLPDDSTGNDDLSKRN